MLGTHSDGSVFLRCRVVEGRNLKAMDLNGFSDPYCVIYITDDDGNKVDSAGTYRTPTVQKTLNPYWNSVFDIGSAAGLRVDDYTLVIEVWDEDTWTSDDNAGVVKVPLWNIPRRWGRQPALDLWVPLHMGKKWIMTELQHMFKGVVDNETLK